MRYFDRRGFYDLSLFCRSIKLSSPRLNNMAAAGCALVYGAVILLGLDHATLADSGGYFPTICTVRIFFFTFIHLFLFPPTEELYLTQICVLPFTISVTGVFCPLYFRHELIYCRLDSRWHSGQCSQRHTESIEFSRGAVAESSKTRKVYTASDGSRKSICYRCSFK